ncbi:hypothetical protein [Streptomyces sp. NPDC004376]
MPAISIGSVEVDIIPNASGIHARLRAALVPPASQIGDEVGRIIGQQLVTHIAPAVTDGIQNGARRARPVATRQGDETAGAFARSMRTRLDAAFRTMPRLDVGITATGAGAELARLRARLDSLADRRIGIDIDANFARTQVADIEERLRRLGAAHPNVAIRADTAAAVAQLAEVRAELDRVTATPGRIHLETDGQLGARLRAAVQEAEASLPNVNIGADTTPAQAEIAALRARLTALRDQRVGIDIDAGAALAQITDIQARLTRLSTRDADIAVRVDAGAATARLAAFQAQVNRLDGQEADVRVDINTSIASLALSNLTTAAIAFGPAILPALPLVASGLGAIAATAVAAGVGIGGIAAVAIPTFKQIGTVLQAQKAAQDAATSATARSGQAASQAASKALQMAGAQQALTAAERNGARQITQAQQQVVQAKQAAADAVAQAAQRNAQAARQVQDAERSLADAQKAAVQAQKDLTAARAQAVEELEDLNNRLTDAKLSERDAEIALTDATAQRDAVLKNANATELDKQKALLAYDQAVQRLKEQTTETSRLKDETAKANKAGVEGSTTYKNAQDQLAQAQQAVADKQQAVRDAQADAARTQVETARQVAQAQQRVSEATANVAVAQQNAADSVASAQRQITSASLSAAGGVDQAALAQAKYQAELAKLSPAARATMNAYTGLKDAFSAWAKSLQPAVMPIFTRALIGIRNVLPTLTPFVTEAADAVKYLQDRFARQIKAPFWVRLRGDLQKSVRPAIIGLGITFENVITGMAGIVDAFLPKVGGMSSSLQRVTGKFANWGKNLRGNPEFEQFLAFGSEKGPLLADAIGRIAAAFLQVGSALTPLSGPLLQIIAGFADFIAVVADKAPWFVLLIYSIIVATKLWTIAQAALNFVMSANPLVLIGLAVLALIAVVIYAYQRFGWFRAGVQAAWAGIKAGALWMWSTLKPLFVLIGQAVVLLWQNAIKPYIGFMIAYWRLVGHVAVLLWTSYLQPAFTAIWSGMQTVGRWAMWLWTNAISPAFHFIMAAARILALVIAIVVLGPIILGFKVLGAVAGWLWKTAIKPAFNAIAAGAKWLYNNGIKPQFDLAVAAFKAAGRAGTWVWEHALKPAFHAIADGAKWLWKSAIKPAWDGIVSAGKWAYDHGIKPIFEGWKRILKGLGSAFSSAVDAIKSAWDKVKSVTRKPVQYVVDVVYNDGIRGVWNKVAGAFGAPKLGVYKFASGGVMPGYTPGRDVHRFVSPTGGRLELSGGEAIMRPEFTRAVGSGFVNSMNAIARARGTGGVRAALAPVFGGNPQTPTDHTLRYKDGGIFGWIGSAASKVAGAGSAAWNSVKKGASWLADTLEASARAGVKNVVDPLLKSFPGMDTGFGRLIRHIPDKIVDALFGYSKKADTKNGGAIGGPRIKAALSWAKSQAGKPYIWGGVGPKGFDCSGFMGAIENVIRGLKPNTRRWATGAFSGRTAPAGWVYHGNSPFRVGITNAGVGHTAGTLGKTNVESRGGAGVVVGSRARGYNDRLFTDWYGFRPGKYDSGGWMPPGMNLMFNGLGQPEAVLTPSQWSALHGAATRGGDGASGPVQFVGDLTLDSGEFLGKVRGEAKAVLAADQAQLYQTLTAS